MARFILAGALLLFTAIGSVVPVTAQPIPGRDYTVLEPPRATSDPVRVVVTEFFSYQCPHCFAFHPALEAWVRSLPDDVAFEREAVSIGRPPWEPAARAFYALYAMDEIDAVDGALFDAIHVDETPLLDKASIVGWVAAHGLDAARFGEMYDGFGIGTRVSRAEQLARDARIPGVPTLLIDGRYVFPIAGNRPFDAQLENVDRLIEAARAKRSQAREASQDNRRPSEPGALSTPPTGSRAASTAGP